MHQCGLDRLKVNSNLFVEQLYLFIFYIQFKFPDNAKISSIASLQQDTIDYNRVKQHCHSQIVVW